MARTHQRNPKTRARVGKGASPPAQQRKRFTARIPEGMQGTLKEAADLVGATVNQFVLQVAYQEAQRLLERESVIRLSQDDAQRIFNLLDQPPKPNRKLTEAAKSFAKEFHA